MSIYRYLNPMTHTWGQFSLVRQSILWHIHEDSSALLGGVSCDTYMRTVQSCKAEYPMTHTWGQFSLVRQSILWHIHEDSSVLLGGVSCDTYMRTVQSCISHSFNVWKSDLVMYPQFQCLERRPSYVAPVSKFWNQT